MSVEGISELEIIELLAISRGMQLIAGLGIWKIIIKSDYLLMIQLCNSIDSVHPCSEVGVLVANIQELMKLYEACKLQHVYQEYNKPLHLLAHHAWQLDNLLI